MYDDNGNPPSTGGPRAGKVAILSIVMLTGILGLSGYALIQRRT